jgi:hypothetical protein
MLVPLLVIVYKKRRPLKVSTLIPFILLNHKLKIKNMISITWAVEITKKKLQLFCYLPDT